MEQTKKPFDPEKLKEQRFEFVLLMDEKKIICQRFFNIRDFNEDSLNSYELKELMDRLCSMCDEYGELGLIPNHLKNKSVDYLWSTYNPFAEPSEQYVKGITDKVNDFQFEIKVDKKTVAKSTFSGNYFPLKVRYFVDIREIIPAIMVEIRDFLSRKN